MICMPMAWNRRKTIQETKGPSGRGEQEEVKQPMGVRESLLRVFFFYLHENGPGDLVQ